jgi:ABC-type polysaccharide/polyol phosphate export permease
VKPIVYIGQVLALFVRQQRNFYQVILLDTFVLPSCLAYLGARMIDSPNGLRTWLSASIALALGLGPVSQVGFSTYYDRFSKRILLLRLMPVPKYSYVVSYLLYATVQCILIVVVSITTFWALGYGRFTLPGLASGLTAAFCAGASLGGLGMMLTFRAANMDSARAQISIAAGGLALVSPVFYSVDALPTIVQPLAWLSPFTSIAILIRASIEGSGAPMSAVGGSLVLTIVFVAISYFAIPWHED